MDNIESITEEKEAKKPFYSYRGVSKCYSAGISFITDNFLFFLKTFSPVFALSGAFTALMFALMPMMVVNVGYVVAYYLDILLILGINLFGVAMLYRLILQDSLGKGFLGYNSWTLLKASRKQINRVVAYAFISIVLGIVSFIPSVVGIFIATLLSGVAEGMDMAKLAQLNSIGQLIVLANFLIVLFVLIIPFKMVLPYMMMEKGNMFKDFFKGIKKGYKIWGKNFGLFMLVSITILVLFCLTTLPCSVLISARTNALLSLQMGDPVTLPAGFSVFVMIAAFFQGFVMSFMSFIDILSFAYLYASAKHDDKQKDQGLKIDELA